MRPGVIGRNEYDSLQVQGSNRGADIHEIDNREMPEMRDDSCGFRMDGSISIRKSENSGSGGYRIFRRIYR